MSRVALTSIRSLMLYKDKETLSRRLSPIPQLTCFGKACKLFTPDVVRCENIGGGSDVEWKASSTCPLCILCMCSHTCPVRGGPAGYSAVWKGGSFMRRVVTTRGSIRSARYFTILLCYRWTTQRALQDRVGLNIAWSKFLRLSTLRIHPSHCPVRLVNLPSPLMFSRTRSAALDISTIVFWVLWGAFLLWILYTFLNHCLRGNSTRTNNFRPAPPRPAPPAHS